MLPHFRSLTAAVPMKCYSHVRHFNKHLHCIYFISEYQLLLSYFHGACNQMKLRFFRDFSQNEQRSSACEGKNQVKIE